MISRLFALWVEGLAAALVSVGTLLRPPRRFQLRANSKPLALYPVGPTAPEPLVSIDDNQRDKVPPAVLERTRGNIVEIVVPASAILQRRLDVLPAESLPY